MRQGRRLTLPKLIDEGRRRGVVDRLRRADLLDPPLVHHHHPVGDFQRFLLVVGDEDPGDSGLVVQAAQPAAQFLAHLGVEGAEGLVQQQALGSMASARASATRCRCPPDSCDG
jgi:hypothetical protein